MKKLRTIDSFELQKRINEGLITVYKHPFLDIYIYNYTSRTQHRGLWDDYTKLCRGLIVDNNFNILNNPFPKFFNFGENEDMMIQNLPKEIPSIIEKLDGRLGILYEEIDKPAIATRGKFDSPYAQWATNWLRLKGYSIEDFKPDYTYLFEIIYPYDKVIVDYGNRAELVLLAVRNNYDNSELNYVKEAEELGFSYAKEFSFSSGIGCNKIECAKDNIYNVIEYLDKTIGTKIEGFVCRYSNGLRIKIKSTDYKRLSKILSGITERDIWSSLKDTGSVEQIMESVPDELHGWIRDVEKDLLEKKTDILNRASIIANDAKKLNNRIEQSMYIINHTKKSENLKGVVYSLLDNRITNAETAIWKLIEPSGENISWEVQRKKMI